LEIRDPIHGNIDLDETVAKIIDTPQMQRLRYIRQLDMTYLVFPGANHTRFEHSLGTMQVTRALLSSINEKEEEMPYAGMLHDIGHGPFSHLSEDLIKLHLKKDHEKIGEEVVRNSEIKDIISDSGLSFDKVMDYFTNPSKMDIVCGALGSDRIDYLMRDSHYTGVAYGVIDYERLKKRLVMHNGRVAVLESGISAAESMLLARYFMHLNVYMHHTRIIALGMLQRAIGLALDSGIIDAQELSMMHDEQLIGRLLGSGSEHVSEMTKRVIGRKLFKRAVYKRVNTVIDTNELEKGIVEAGFDKNDFVVKIVNLAGGSDDIDVVDLDGNLTGKLTELSPLIKALSGVLTNSGRLIVACDKKNAERVREAVNRIVG